MLPRVDIKEKHLELWNFDLLHGRLLPTSNSSVFLNRLWQFVKIILLSIICRQAFLDPILFSASIQKNESSWGTGDWSKFLICTQYLTIHWTPFQCVYGFQPPLFLALEKEVNVADGPGLCLWQSLWKIPWRSTHLSHLKPVKDSPLVPASRPPPTRRLMGGIDSRGWFKKRK